MASIHERFKRVFRSISFVECQIECGVVSPAVVSIELIDWQELDGVDPQPIEII